MLTKDDVSKIYSGELGIVLVSALRFRDGAGIHEAHVCTWTQSFERLDAPNGPVYRAAWHNCGNYINQVDLK